MRLALVQSLAPDALNGAALVEVVVATTDRRVAYLLSDALTSVALTDVDAILVALTPTLVSRAATSATEAHLTIASHLACVGPSWTRRSEHCGHPDRSIVDTEIGVVDSEIAIMDAKIGVVDSEIADRV